MTIKKQLLGFSYKTVKTQEPIEVRIPPLEDQKAAQFSTQSKFKSRNLKFFSLYKDNVSIDRKT